MASPDGDRSASLPGGTGLTTGVGEALRLDLNTGQAVYSLPLKLPKGVADLTPALRLEYSAARGNGPCGIGWDIPIRSIRRRLDYGVPYDDAGTSGVAERFLDGDLELGELGDGTYAPIIETAFTRYQRVGDGWVITERNGLRHDLGVTAAARVADPDHPERVVGWLLERTVDTSGNEVEYRYRAPNASGHREIEAIRYAAYQVTFVDEERPDVLRDGRSGCLRITDRRLARVEVEVATGGSVEPLRSWRLGYRIDEASGASLLDSVVVVGHRDGAEVALPPVTFTYRAFDPAAIDVRVLDSLGADPPPLDDPDVALVALDAIPLPGVLQVRDGVHVYWPNPDGRTFRRPRVLRGAPNVPALASAGAQILDMDGNGTADLLVAAGTGVARGYYRNDGSDGWGGFVGSRRGVEPSWTDGARPVDLDHDGVVDAIGPLGRRVVTWHNQGDGRWSDPTVRSAPTADGRPVSLGDPLVRLADMTGDGQADLVEVRSGGIRYWPSLGNGRFGAAVLMADSPRLTGITDDPGGVVLVDLSGDGASDLVRVDGRTMSVWMNRSGTGFSSPVTRIVPPLLPGSLRVADMAGEGRANLVWSTPRRGGTAVVCAAVGQPHPYRLERADNGQGLVSSFEYTTSVAEARRDLDRGETWSGHLPFVITVLNRTVETDEARATTTETRYRYHDGRHDPRTRIFAGFTKVEQVEVGDASRPDRTTLHHYSAGRGLAALDRLLERVEVQAMGPDGHPLVFRREETAYSARPLPPTRDGAARHAIAVDDVRVAWPDGTADERIEHRRYRYDDVGNVVREETTVSGAVAGTTVATDGWVIETEYAHDAARHVYDRLSRVVRRAVDGTLLGEVRHHYDGDGFVGLPLGRVERGLLARKRRLAQLRADFDAHHGPGVDPADLGFSTGTTVDGDAGVFVDEERSSHDGRGLVVAELDPLGVETRKVYDADGLFAIRKDGPLGTTVLEPDHHAGEPRRILDPDGSEVVLRYDGLGRLTSVVLPGDTPAEPTRTYAYDTAQVPVAVTGVYRRAPGGRVDATMTKVTYFDGVGGELQQRVVHDTDKVVVSGWKQVNGFGDVVEELEPTFAATLDFAVPPLVGRPSRRFTYDVEGRAVRTVNFNGAESRLTISPFEILLADPVQLAAGVARRELLDVRHRRVRVDEPTDAGVLTTRYRIGELGELLEVHDHRGLLVTYGYDMLGHRLTIDHREAGERRLVVDASGRVVATVDAEGDRVEATFDDAGRIETLSINGASTETYAYDPPRPGGLGRLARVTYPGGAQSFEYTERGQVSRIAYEFDGRPEPDVVEYAYDGFGNETLIRHPDGTEVGTEYFANGWVRRVPGFVDEVEFDPRGLPVRTTLANGVVTEVGHTAGVGRVATSRTVGPDGTVHDDLTYGHDALMRVTSRADARTGTTRTTTYDLLHQLDGVDDGTFSASYRYDGRDVVTNGEADVELRYEDPGRPGLVTGVVRGPAAPELVSTDANGAITALGLRRLDHDAKGNLVSVQDGPTTVRFAYDHRGERTVKAVARGGNEVETRFVGDRTEISGATTTVHVVVGTWRIAVKRGSRTRFVHTDELGTGRFFTDETGRRLDGVTIQPFGGNLDPSQAVTPQMFALHPFDAETGLYYARRRYYSPDLGRWITPDGLYLQRPETDEGEPRTLALYAYVANDPVNYVDPMGRSIWTVLGGIVGVVVGVVLGALVLAAFASGIGFGILALVGVALLIGAAYAGAAALDPTSDFGQFMQGFLIGVNAGLNAVLAGAIFGPVIGIALGVINFLAVFDDVRTSPIYQGILGWSNFVQPMSWLVVGLGLVFFILNLVGHVLFWASGGSWTFFEVKGFQADWATGTFGVRGGWISNLNPIDTAFNMGNFVFTDDAATGDPFQHEIGHNLNLAILGSAVHFAGAIDENAIRGHDALTEQMAESHDPTSGRGRLAGWWI